MREWAVCSVAQQPDSGGSSSGRVWGEDGGGRTSTSIQVFNEKMHFKKVDLEMGGTTQAPDKKGRSGSATLSVYTILDSLY